MVSLVASFPWVSDPGKACNVLWDTFQCSLRKFSAGKLAGAHYLTPSTSSSHVHLSRQAFCGHLGQDLAAVPHLPKLAAFISGSEAEMDG